MNEMGKHLIELYGKDELIKRFGTLQPTVTQRANELELLWFAYGEDNEINRTELDLDEFGYASEFSNMLRTTYGPFNVVFRGVRIRFKDEADAVLA